MCKDNEKKICSREEEMRGIEKIDVQLINMILDSSIENKMSLQEVGNCFCKVAEVYFTDGLITKK